MNGRRALACMLLVAVLTGCQWLCPQDSSTARFVPGPAGPAVPWTDRGFADDPDDFQFAVVADLTGGNRPGIFEDAVGKLNLLQPEFVLCVGDLIEGYTDQPAVMDEQWDDLGARVAPLRMRFFHLPGNHDISNPAMAEKWQERFGRPYYHFVYKDVLFLCLDSEDPPETRVSEQQVAYVADVLEANPDVRWTFALVHEPMWLAPDAGWQQVQAMLAGRPHTVLAGHHHTYARYEREGRSYIKLATTGGASELRGPYVGEFDHVTWVTVTDEGPVIVNLALDGMLAEDVVTEEVAALNEALSAARYLSTDGIVATERLFTRGEGEVRLANSLEVPVAVRGSLAQHPQLVGVPDAFEAELGPGESRTVPIVVEAKQPTELWELTPLRLELVATYRREGRPVSVPARVHVDVHGGQEGPDLVENGRFEEDTADWFTWVHSPQFGSVGAEGGEFRVHLNDDTEFFWSAGMGQNVPLRPGGRYRAAFKAANEGGPSVLRFQVGIEGQEMPLTVLAGGAETATVEVAIGPEMQRHVVEFTVPRGQDMAGSRILLVLGDLREARIDDVSLRELVPGGATAR